VLTLNDVKKFAATPKFVSSQIGQDSENSPDALHSLYFGVGVGSGVKHSKHVVYVVAVVAVKVSCVTEINPDGGV
jgi:hypothetical protein